MTQPVTHFRSATASHRHFLAIGGTGMLAAATLELAHDAQFATIVARHADAFVALHELRRARAVVADWTRDDFAALVASAISAGKAVDLCVAWVHTSGQAAFDSLVPELARAPCRLIQVLGSATGDPWQLVDRWRARLEGFEQIVDNYVVLGSVLQAGLRRWLRHDEISAGVLTCVTTGADVVVGEIVP